LEQEVPFTGSHPAAVLPLLGTRLVPSALVIGSISPDLLYYLALPDPVRWRLSELSHSLLGILWFDLAMGLLAFVLWQALITPLAIAVSPRAVRDRLGPDLPVPLHFAGPRLVVTSLLIGAATHVLWDEFTHPGRWGTENIPWLAAQHGLLPGYRWGQYGSSIVGLIAIGWVLVRWWIRTAPQPGSQRVRALHPAVSVGVWVLVLVCTALGAGVGAWAAYTDSLGTGSMAYLVSTYGGGAGLLAIFLSALLVSSVSRSRFSG
jgi:hypothetical protein